MKNPCGVFLIGGGWQTETFPQTYGRFLQAAAQSGQSRIAFIVAEEVGADAREQFLRFFRAFETIGLKQADAFEIIVSAEKPLSKENLAEIEPGGVFVCGGLTPAYFDALCIDKSWLGFLEENKIPYCGFSAGASVASENAVIGGWRRKINNQIVEIAGENAGEDLDFLDVRRGLGLVSFAVDVHATQWGTLSRLVHAVDARFADEGVAIDENTMLEISENRVSVHGAGNIYLVRRTENQTAIDIFQSGTHISK